MKIQAWLVGACVPLALFFPAFSQADILALYDFEVVQAFEEDFQANFGLSVSHDSNADTDASFYQTRSGGFSSFDSGITPNRSNFENHGFGFSTNTGEVGGPNSTSFYHQFDVEIVDGEYTLDALQFDYWVNNTQNIGDFSVSVYSDLTGFAAGSELIQFDYIQQTNQAVEVQQVDLSGLDQITQFQNLTAGDEVEFRLVFNDNFPNGFVHRVDNITLTGTNLTAVPEPTAVSLLAVIGMAGIARRRR